MRLRKYNMVKNQKGFSLLEYVIGASLLAGIVWVAMQTMGTSMENFFVRLGGWLGDRTQEISVNNP